MFNLENRIESHENFYSLEQSMKNVHYEFFDEWVQNFAKNLNNIWNESSARELTPNIDPALEDSNHPAIVIGRGPSIKKKKHLELLAGSNFKGSIICCDGALIDVLSAGVTPEKFPKFHVITIDPYPRVRKLYDNKIVEQFGAKINGIFTTISSPAVVERARQAGLKIHWIHSLLDINEGKKSFNYISSQMVRSNKHTNGLPAIQTGGNVGTSAWFVSWKILKCNIVALIGINHGWEDDDPLETIIHHGMNEKNLKIEENSPLFHKLFPRIFNPDLKKYCILDPLFQYYRTALIEFIARSPKWLTTINATEGGSIFGERIKSTTLGNFLKSDFSGFL